MYFLFLSKNDNKESVYKKQLSSFQDCGTYFHIEEHISIYTYSYKLFKIIIKIF